MATPRIFQLKYNGFNSFKVIAIRKVKLGSTVRWTINPNVRNVSSVAIRNAIVIISNLHNGPLICPYSFFGQRSKEALMHRETIQYNTNYKE